MLALWTVIVGVFALVYLAVRWGLGAALFSCGIQQASPSQIEWAYLGMYVVSGLVALACAVLAWAGLRRCRKEVRLELGVLAGVSLLVVTPFVLFDFVFGTTDSDHEMVSPSQVNWRLLLPGLRLPESATILHAYIVRGLDPRVFVEFKVNREELAGYIASATEVMHLKNVPKPRVLLGIREGWGEPGPNSRYWYEVQEGEETPWEFLVVDDDANVVYLRY